MQSNGDERPDAQVDDLVRGVLAPRPDAAERLVQTALRSGPASAGGAAARLLADSRRRVFAAAAALLLVGVVFSVTLYRDPEPLTPPPPRGMLSNEGPVTIIAMPGCPITIVGPGGSSSPVPAGTASIELLGEPR
ncbi:MAG: hypothetical protein Q7V01_11190 [Vicinamibacterales bacterium]|nr:hypothetical protein [Vicinamibacterales bacterium]